MSAREDVCPEKKIKEIRVCGCSCECGLVLFGLLWM